MQLYWNDVDALMNERSVSVRNCSRENDLDDEQLAKMTLAESRIQ
jgi:hypothetical protein